MACIEENKNEVMNMTLIIEKVSLDFNIHDHYR